MCLLKNYIKSFLGTLQLSSRLSISCCYLNFSLQDIGWAYDCQNDFYVYMSWYLESSYDRSWYISCSQKRKEFLNLFWNRSQKCIRNSKPLNHATRAVDGRFRFRSVDHVDTNYIAIPNLTPLLYGFKSWVMLISKSALIYIQPGSSQANCIFCMFSN